MFTVIFCTQVWGPALFCFCALWFLPSLPPPPSSSSALSLTSFGSSWTMSWCLTITASVSLSHTHTRIQCCLGWHCLANVYSPPQHSEWLFSTALVCASLPLYSGFKSTQLVLSMVDYFVCFFVLPLKLSGSMIPKLDLFVLSDERSILQCHMLPVLNILLCLLCRAGCTWQLYMMQYSLPVKTNMLTSSFPLKLRLALLILLLIRLFLCSSVHIWKRALTVCLLLCFCSSLCVCFTFRWEFWAESFAENL